MIERLYGNSHLLNDAGQYAYYGRVGGCLVTGNEDGVKHCAMNVLYSLQHLGYTIPPQADAGWIGEAGPGPSYLDEGSGGPENDFTNRNTTFAAWNMMHLARMLKDAGGIPAHGNQRTEWDAGCRFDFPNPDYRLNPPLARSRFSPHSDDNLGQRYSDVCFEALGEAVHAALAGGGGGAGPVGGAVGRGIDAGVAQGGDVLEGEQVLAAVDQRRAQLRPPLADRVVEDRLERAVLAQQIGRGLRADALGAGQAVGRVAAQGDEVGDLLRVDAVALAHPPRARPLRRLCRRRCARRGR